MRGACLGWLAAIFLAGCSEAPQKRPEVGALRLRPTRGYILITFDALRSDHLGAYGYERSTSPFFDQLARRGILFERAVAPYPSTLVSNMSLFTGLLPEEHGVYPPSGVLSPRIETLPERLRRHGFRTAGHTEGGFMAGGYGFARGFEEFTDTPYEAETDMERTFSRGLGFLRRLGERERFFLFLHTYSPHDPYDPPPAYRSLFLSGDQIVGPAPNGATLKAINSGQLAIEPERLVYFKALYDASIRYAYDALRKFFEQLQSLGLAEDTTVFITADHGEEFLEHGKVGHTQLYPECLQVPLLIVHPDLAEGVRIARPVSTVDLAPTLLESAGLEPLERISGRSLVPLLTASEGGPPAAVYAEVIDEATVRTLIGEHEERIYQLLVFEPTPDPAGTWISRSVSFHTATRQLEFEAQSFHRPRAVRLSVDGVAHGGFEVETSWRPVKIELPHSNRSLRLVTLTAEGCNAPAQLSLGDDDRCLSVQIRGMPLQRFELYDLSHDIGATVDLAESRAAVRRGMARQLDDYRRKLVAEPGKATLTEESRETLRALGYLD
ncbi:MAG: sulfatase [Thermoanaerobaculia bacterium]